MCGGVRGLVRRRIWGIRCGRQEANMTKYAVKASKGVFRVGYRNYPSAERYYVTISE